MSRALVVVTYGDREWSEPMAGVIVEGMTRRVIPLDSEELAAAKAEPVRSRYYASVNGGKGK